MAEIKITSTVDITFTNHEYVTLTEVCELFDTIASQLCDRNNSDMLDKSIAFVKTSQTINNFLDGRYELAD